MPLEAAKRELEEETNLVAEEWVKMMEMVSPLDSAMKITLFKQKCDGQRKCRNQQTEDNLLKSSWMPLEEVMQKIQTGEIADAKTIIAAQYA